MGFLDLGFRVGSQDICSRVRVVIPVDAFVRLHEVEGLGLEFRVWGMGFGFRIELFKPAFGVGCRGKHAPSPHPCLS